MESGGLQRLLRGSAWIIVATLFAVNIVAYRRRPREDLVALQAPASAFSLENKSPASNSSSESPIFISLSSIPARLPRIKKVLHHLFNQSKAADAVYVSLPWWSTRESKFYDIPDFLQDGGEFGGKVRLLRSFADYGPATKFVPIIQELKQQRLDNARVIVLDDDQEYPPEMVAAYDKWSKLLPESALTLRGHKMLDHKPVDWGKIAFGNIIHSYELANLTCVDIITAVGSYMIRPRFFTPELWEALYIHESHSSSSSRLRGARNADDVWISGMLARNGVPRHAIPGRKRAWDPSQPQSKYFTDMTIHPWEPAHESQTGTPALGGGGDSDNSQLIEAFWDKWSCFGDLMTLPKCPQKDGHDMEFMRGVPCVQQGGAIMHG